mgnify:CR=1 FL=1
MNKKLSILLILTVLLTSCSRVEVPYVIKEGDSVPVSLALSIGDDDFTKGVHDPGVIGNVADVIKNLWVIQFDGVSDNSRILGEPVYLESFSESEGVLSADVNLIAVGNKCTIYLNLFNKCINH